jgi:hypothetical protein
VDSADGAVLQDQVAIGPRHIDSTVLDSFRSRGMSRRKDPGLGENLREETDPVKSRADVENDKDGGVQISGETRHQNL